MVALLLAFIFRTSPLGVVIRDAVALNATSFLLVGSGFARAQAIKFDATSHLVAIAGFGLCGAAFAALGADLTYFGAQLAPEAFQGVTVTGRFLSCDECVKRIVIPESCH